MTKEDFINVVHNSPSMAAAATSLGLHFSTFKSRAVKYGCYTPNQGGKNTKKPWSSNKKIPLDDILNGGAPQYHTYKLKVRLFREGLKTNRCEMCGIDSWLGSSISLELDHIDGIRSNHALDNLRVLCPNCHSQTETFRYKRGKTKV